MVYCFEPIKATFDILKKNIELNNLENKTVLYNCAVGKSDGFAEVHHFNRKNIGGTKIIERNNGDIKVITIDTISSVNHVDFIKIDVEGFEYNVLKGCTETIKRYKPVVFIECSPNNFAQVDSFFKNISHNLYKIHYQVNK